MVFRRASRIFTLDFTSTFTKIYLTENLLKQIRLQEFINNLVCTVVFSFTTQGTVGKLLFSLPRAGFEMATHSTKFNNETLSCEVYA